MIKYFISENEKDCCGCRACEQKCAQDAILMRTNGEGFLFPDIDLLNCVKCGICESVCPMENKPQENVIRAAYAFQHGDIEKLKGSSSGGAFRMLADWMVESGGYVVGCKWSDTNTPVLAMTDTIKDLINMQGSKYVFSDTNKVYKKIEKELKVGRKVLFTGAPCQCAGLLNYLGKTYENLITADFLCHGMPSQMAFDLYIEFIEKKVGAKIYDVCFRDKSKRGWGMTFSYKYFKSGKEKRKFNVGWTDPYLYGYVQGYLNRYSCYSCPFKGNKRITDFTFCDYWGVENSDISLIYEQGVSAVFINSEKAEQIFAKNVNKGQWIKTQIENVARENSTVIEAKNDKIPDLRLNVYSGLQKYGWKTIATEYFRVDKYWIKKIWYTIPYSWSKVIRKAVKNVSCFTHNGGS